MNTDYMYVYQKLREIHFYRQLSWLKEFIVQGIYLLKTEHTILKHIILVSLVSIENKSLLIDDISFEYESMAIFIYLFLALLYSYVSSDTYIIFMNMKVAIF